MLTVRKENFLFEIGTEEIPARFMAPVLKQLKENAAKELRDARLTYGDIQVYGTPRRIALVVADLAGRQADLSEKKKGPAAKAAFDANGLPTSAAAGFARSQGIPAEELITEELDGVMYVFALRSEAGKDAREILPALCERLLRSLSFPKPMFWDSKEIRFARPIRWLTSLYGGEAVVFSFAGLTSTHVTYGHRFLAPAGVSLADAANYLQALEQSFVVADQEKRRNRIAQQVTEAAAKLGGRTTLDEDLLEEVVHLVEYPKAVTGHFSRDYLEIPPEVLITAMRAHQRYFPVFDESDNLLPYFITISNGTKDEYAGNVRAGNERVLRARLADARFFFEEDRKKAFPNFVDMLDSIVFMEPLGTMRKKTDRIVALASALGRELALPQETAKAAERAAYLAKADIMTHMVYEFPELQGTMGMHYARLSGEAEEVAVAINEHYAPRFAGDEPAPSIPGALVAIADKMDTLAACFGLGLIPTGSQDPYALRRSAAGVVATLAAHHMGIPMRRLCELALTGLAGSITRPAAEVAPEMEEFLLQRVRHSLMEQGFRYDVIDAALGSAAKDLPGLSARAQALQAKLHSLELTRILTPFTRAANLTKDFAGSAVNEECLTTAAERQLFAAVQAADSAVAAAAAAGDYSAVFDALAPLFSPIEQFFTDVMVMVDDTAVRNNRLALLAQVKELFLTLGDLAKIVQEKK